ncbi:hypothetical protein I7I48_02871 [Histoplasma ohiense]|nr:hypothetical protein I7I48_02871 [Histoplasma ohiense (nom. inval.)]
MTMFGAAESNNSRSEKSSQLQPHSSQEQGKGKRNKKGAFVFPLDIFFSAGFCAVYFLFLSLLFFFYITPFPSMSLLKTRLRKLPNPPRPPKKLKMENRRIVHHLSRSTFPTKKKKKTLSVPA